MTATGSDPFWPPPGWGAILFICWSTNLAPARSRFGWGFTPISRADGIVRQFIRWAVEMEYATPEVKWGVCDMRRRRSRDSVISWPGPCR